MLENQSHFLYDPRRSKGGPSEHETRRSFILTLTLLCAPAAAQEVVDRTTLGTPPSPIEPTERAGAGGTSTCPIVFAADSNLDELFQISTVDGSTTLIGSTVSGPETPAGLAWDGSAMYVIDLLGGELYTVDLATAATTLIGTSGITGWQGLASDPTDGGQLYAITQDGTLHTIDSSTGAETLVASGVGSLITSLTFDASGTLWGTEFGGELVNIDKTNGAVTLIGPTLAGIQGLDFCPDGTLYGVSTDDDSLYEIDPTTGGATLVGASPPTVFVKGLAFDLVVPVELQRFTVE